MLRRHLRRAPDSNPFERFAARFAHDLTELPSLGADHFHAYAFANFRQIGAAFELAAAHLEWLAAPGPAGIDSADLSGAQEAFASIAAQAKSLQMKTARAALAKRTVDTSVELTAMATAWMNGIGVLRTSLG